MSYHIFPVPFKCLHSGKCNLIPLTHMIKEELKTTSKIMTTSVVLYCCMYNQLPQILWLKIAYTFTIPQFLSWESWHSVAGSSACYLTDFSQDIGRVEFSLGVGLGKNPLLSIQVTGRRNSFRLG